MHTEDPGHWAHRGYQLDQVRWWQQTLVRIYTQVRELGIQGPSPQGLTARSRGSGPVRLPRPMRTDSKWASNHLLQTHESTIGCLSCGRTTRAKRQGRLQQWRRPCQPLKGHRQRLEHRHQPVWEGEWRCNRCPLKGSDLRRHGCLFRHPTGGRRYTSKRASMCGVREPTQMGSDVVASGQRAPKQAKLTECWARGKRPPGQSRISDFFVSASATGQAQSGGKRPPAHLVGAFKRPRR